MLWQDGLADLYLRADRMLGEWEPPTGCERAGTQVRPATAAFQAEAMRLTQLRLRSVGFLAEEGPARDPGREPV